MPAHAARARALVTARSILVAGALGLILNSLVTWRCLWIQWGPNRVTPGQSAQSLWDGWAVPNPAHGPATFQHLSGATGCDFLILSAEPASPTPGLHPRMMITRGGFPLRSFEGMHSWGGVTPAFSWAIPIRPFNPNVAWLSIIPLRPMPGLLANVLIYGGLCWVFLFGPLRTLRSIQRQRRIGAKRCPECGYNLTGQSSDGCPECGWQRE